jgi:hypothetical protein
MGEIGLGLLQLTIPALAWRELRKATKILTEGSRSLDRDSNSALPDRRQKRHHVR